MLIPILLASCFSLAVVIGLVRAGRIRAAVGVCWGLLIVSCGFSMALTIQVIATFPMFLLLQLQRGRQWFTAGAVAAAVFAYAFVAYMVVSEAQRRVGYREQYPLISLEDRLPPSPRRDSQSESFDRDSLGVVEREIADEFSNYAFRTLHEESVYQFVNSPGFGVGRGLPRGHLWIRKPQPSKPVPQPAPSWRSEGDAGEPQASRSREHGLLLMHLHAVVDFVNFDGFGYVRNRSEVSGFRPHRFSRVPTETTTPTEKTEWKVDAVELVGVLVADTPRVYVSKNLPRMEDLSKTKTRPLDIFETEGLASIKDGGELHIRSAGEGLRMMGAIRNAKQCVACHGGQRGDLLGAFAYQMHKAE